MPAAIPGGEASAVPQPDPTALPDALAAKAAGVSIELVGGDFDGGDFDDEDFDIGTVATASFTAIRE